MQNGSLATSIGPGATPMKFGSARWTIWGWAERNWSKTVMGSVSASSVRRTGVGGAVESRSALNGGRVSAARWRGNWKDALCVGRLAGRVRAEHELSGGAEEVRDAGPGPGEELWAPDVGRTRSAGCAGLAAWVVRDA